MVQSLLEMSDVIWMSGMGRTAKERSALHGKVRCLEKHDVLPHSWDATGLVHGLSATQATMDMAHVIELANAAV